MMAAAVVHIESPVLRGTVDSSGAFLRELKVLLGGQWSDVFQPGKALFVMGPHVGRVEGGRFPWQGESFDLRHDADPLYAMHGTYRNVDWTWGACSSESAVLELDSRSLGTRYPSPSSYQARVSYQVDGDKLIVKSFIRVTGGSSMPFGTGPHMYALKRPAGTTGAPSLLHHATSWFPMRDDKPLPKGSEEPLPEGRRYSELRPWSEDWDHCVGNWGDRVTIAWPELSIEVLDRLGNCPYLQIWNTADKDVCAVEPQTMVPTKLGDTDDAKRYGCLLLEPGAEFEAEWEFRFKA
ncbi:MAG: hypothetical protein KDD69_03895 [Bdellovibrionales bacterium]|nr:hypothetical protein [Bdellovibrionales bacterium]